MREQDLPHLHIMQICSTLLHKKALKTCVLYYLRHWKQPEQLVLYIYISMKFGVPLFQQNVKLFLKFLFSKDTMYFD